MPIPNQKKSFSEDFSDCRLSDTFALKIHTQVNREELGWLAGPLSLALASLWAGKPEPPCKAFLTRSLSNRRTFPLTFWSCSQLPFTRTPPGAARKFTVTHILRGSPPSLSSLHPARQEPVETLASYTALTHAEVSFQPSAITNGRLHVKKGHVNKVSIQTGAAEETSGHSRLCLLLPCLPGV